MRVRVCVCACVRARWPLAKGCVSKFGHTYGAVLALAFWSNFCHATVDVCWVSPSVYRHMIGQTLATLFGGGVLAFAVLVKLLSRYSGFVCAGCRL